MRRYVSIDVGGTAIKYGIIREDGQILEKHGTDTQAWKGGPWVSAQVQEIAGQLCAREEISGICISTAGIVDTREGKIIHSAPLIPGYTGTEYKKILENRFQIPCEVENDVNCAGLAESRSGAAAGSEVSLTLTVGTGIGGSIVIAGEVFHGFCGSACEVGYMTLPGGRFQDLGAASVLAKEVAFRKGDPEEEWDGFRVFEAAKRGDLVCVQAIDGMADILGQGIANICYVVNPEVVVLGGGIMAQKEYLRGRIEASLGKYLIPEIACHTRLAFAAHGNDAGMLGAFYHFQGRHLERG